MEFERFERALINKRSPSTTKSIAIGQSIAPRRTINLTAGEKYVERE